MTIIEPVCKSILVNATPERAFTVFAAGTWWPLVQSTLPDTNPRKAVVMEPRVGGRWYEVAADGTEKLWGEVLAWEPPRRMLLGWQLTSCFQHNPKETSEVEVKFIPEGDKTRVKLEHRGFEKHGATAQQIRDAVDSGGGWGVTLEHLAQAILAK